MVVKVEVMLRILWWGKHNMCSARLSNGKQLRRHVEALDVGDTNTLVERKWCEVCDQK
jgi:hypothetical protein